MRPQGVVLLGVCLAVSTAPGRLLAQAALFRRRMGGDPGRRLPLAPGESLSRRAPARAASRRCGAHGLTYDLTLAGESVTGTAIADIDVLKDGWVRS